MAGCDSPFMDDRRAPGASGKAEKHPSWIMFDDDEDIPDPEPPLPARVARRALVLSALCCRSGIEDDADNPEAEAFRRDVLAWLEEVGASEEAEPEERAVLSAPLGTLTERQVIDCGWRAEGLGVLAWALGRCDLPSYQTTVSAPDVADTIDFMKPEAARMIDGAKLRDSEQLETLAERLLALHWRLRQFSLNPEHMDFESFARTAYFGPLDVGGLDLVRGDLAVDGRPLMDVGESRWNECMSIARERQQAANWLCGQEVLYSDVTCDT